MFLPLPRGAARAAFLVLLSALGACSSTFDVRIPAHRLRRIEPSARGPEIQLVRDRAKEMATIEESFGAPIGGRRRIGAFSIHYLSTPDPLEDRVAVALEDRLRALGYRTREVDDASGSSCSVSFEILRVTVDITETGGLTRGNEWGSELSVNFRVEDEEGLVEDFSVDAGATEIAVVLTTMGSNEDLFGRIIAGAVGDAADAAAERIDVVLRRKGVRKE